MSTKKAPMRQKKDKKAPARPKRGQNAGHRPATSAEASSDRPSDKSRQNAPRHSRSLQPQAVPVPKDCYALWGHHALAAALGNHKRAIKALYCTKDSSGKLAALIAPLSEARRQALPQPKIVERAQLDALPSDSGKAVHQGLAAAVRPLDHGHLEDRLATLADDRPVRFMILDQVSDPRNIGAILRSARAFGISALIVQDRHAPEETGTLARTSVGAIEDVAVIRVVNLARAIDALKDHHFHIAGLDMDGSHDVSRTAAQDRVALVMGSEGKGMRRLVREACDEVLAIAMHDSSESLNVSVAAAIIMHATQSQR